MEPDDELLAFFKALADASRLKIIGILANRPHTVEELAAGLHLSEATISHHLGRLSETGLVEGRATGYYSLYSLKTEALENMARRLLSRESLASLAAPADLDAYDRKVRHDFLTEDGRLKEIPAQRKKLEAILRYIVQVFARGVRYSDKEANEMLAKFHEDTATLRRELVGYHMLERGAGVYWRK